MSEPTNEKIAVELTDEQRQKSNETSRPDDAEIEFQVEQLEERIAPISCG